MLTKKEFFPPRTDVLEMTTLLVPENDLTSKPESISLDLKYIQIGYIYILGNSSFWTHLFDS